MKLQQLDVNPAVTDPYPDTNQPVNATANVAVERLDLHRAKVLVVDDIAANVAVVEAMLASAGFGRVTGLTDPLLACEAFESLAPDLVILDLHMPNLDGVELLRQLRRVRVDDYVPIAVLTADVNTSARERALAAGASDFLLKPVDRLELTLRAANMLETRFLYKRLAGEHAAVSGALQQRLVQERKLAFQVDSRRKRIEGVLDRGDVLGMHYQPLVSLASGTAVGFEALARFNTEPYRPPNEWFADADAAGLGPELELRAVQRVGVDAARVPSGCFVSVNVSPMVATDPRFRDALSAFEPSDLVVELTEQSAVAETDADRFVESLASLRSTGVRVAIDDAGSGYAGLHRLMRVRPDIIKLDRTMVMRAPRDPAAAALISAIVQFAEAISSVVIAEGVETEEEVRAAHELGVGLGQGYYFARPCVLDDALTMIETPPW